MMELSLGIEEEEIKCSCKGKCKRSCQCAKQGVKCSTFSKCNSLKCENKKEEVCIKLINKPFVKDLILDVYLYSLQTTID